MPGDEQNQAIDGQDATDFKGNWTNSHHAEGVRTQARNFQFVMQYGWPGACP